MKKITILLALLLFFSGLTFAQNTYYQFGSLNSSTVAVGSDWTKLGTGTYSFTVSEDGSQVEVFVNSRFQVSDINGTGVKFMVRVDDATDPNFANEASIRNANSDEFLSIFAVFDGLSAGSHTVSLWAKVPFGDATGVIADPGGWGGKIIVKILGQSTVSVPEPKPAKDREVMKQNYPNPFYPETTIEYVVQQPSQVVLNVFDSKGQLVKTLVNEHKAPGEYSVVWNSKDRSGRTVSSGNYYYQIRVGDFVSTKKMIVFK